MRVMPGAIVPVRQCEELGRRWYADRLSPQWAPKTAETMRRIFAEVGLDGEFWRIE